MVVLLNHAQAGLSLMLFVYARHTPECSHRDDVKYRRCRCPKWIDGSVDGKRARQSAQTRSWEQAERKARLMEEAADPAARRPPVPTSIAHAVEAFLADEKGRSLSKETTKQSRTLLEKQFLAWAKHRGLSRLRDLTPPELLNFRATWHNNGLTANRKLSRLVGFCAFCIQNGWLQENPAAKVKRATVHSLPTGWFPKPEFKRIVDATYAYGEWRGGRDYQFRADRLRALVLLMRWSGLAIQDAVTLERERLSDDGKLFLYRAKTGVAVYVPIPPDVAETLRALPSNNPRYFFWSGNGDPQTGCKGWRRSLVRLFEIARIRLPDGTPKRCHAHMFRDTFAVELLNKGVPIDRVSLLLGHSSVKVTEKHYAPFVKERQQQLEMYARMAWEDAGVDAAAIAGGSRSGSKPVSTPIH
jgi:integrase/recombinase XerD